MRTFMERLKNFWKPAGMSDYRWQTFNSNSKVPTSQIVRARVITVIVKMIEAAYHEVILQIVIENEKYENVV